MSKYQTIYLRFGALIIDYLLLIPFVALGNYISSNLYSVGLSSSFSVFAVSLGIWAVYTFYFISMHAFFGKTLGKMFVGVKVVNSVERKINFGQSMIRSLPQIIPVIIILGFNSHYLMTGETNQKEIQIANSVESLLSIAVLLWTILNIIVALSDDKHRALHDYFAGTIVVKPK